MEEEEGKKGKKERLSVRLAKLITFFSLLFSSGTIVNYGAPFCLAGHMNDSIQAIWGTHRQPPAPPD